MIGIVHIGAYAGIFVMGILIANAKLIYEVRIENVCFASYEIFTLNKAVAATSKASAVKHISQGSGIKVRLIRVGETRKSLISFAGVPVHACVPSPSVVSCAAG